jgi:ubiquinone/menaquinone biosynthesis C-methylase UbiE
MASNLRPNIPNARQTQAPATNEKPFPARFFECMTAFQKGAALKGAIELDLFTVLAESSQTPESLALRLQASARGMRILCDYLTVEGFLAKEDRRYSVTPDAAMFLNRKSPAYIGSAAFFLGDPMLIENFRDLAGCVRKGGTLATQGTLMPESPIWVEFARHMAPIAAMDAELVARVLQNGDRECKVLDIAAGHGMYGIALARSNPKAEVVALDWKNVLEVARDNAAKAGISSQYRTIEGSAFEADFGEGYDTVLLTNFLHHFNSEMNESLLRKVHRALKPGGRAVALEFVPNEDRVTPPIPAEFSLVMLASTPDGDTYTFPELERMFRNTGFRSAELHEIPPSMQRIVLATK